MRVDVVLTEGTGGTGLKMLALSCMFCAFKILLTASKPVLSVCQEPTHTFPLISTARVVAAS